MNIYRVKYALMQTTTVWRRRSGVWELATVVPRSEPYRLRAEQFLDRWPDIVQARQARRSRPADPLARVIP